jgi:hypothetical protein
MMKVEIWGVRTKKLPAIRQTPLYKWRIRMRRLMWNRTPILRAKFVGEAALWLGLFRLRHLLRRETFFSGFLELASARLRRRHPLNPASAALHNEPPLTVTTEARFGGSADDR